MNIQNYNVCWRQNKIQTHAIIIDGNKLEIINPEHFLARVGTLRK